MFSVIINQEYTTQGCENLDVILLYTNSNLSVTLLMISVRTYINIYKLKVMDQNRHSALR